MLHRPRSSGDELFINLTPMIDVILTLLLFFMAATKLYDWDEQSIDVSVPRVGRAKPLTAAPDPLVLLIQKEGDVSIRGEQIPLPKLQGRLEEARRNYPEQAVVIRADGQALHQFVASVMSICQAAGIDQILVSVKELKNE